MDELGACSASDERLDADGLTMTPGLIDAHVHLGVSSPIQPQFSFQISAAEIAKGKISGPTEMWSSHRIPGLCALSMMAGDADELRRSSPSRRSPSQSRTPKHEAPT